MESDAVTRRDDSDEDLPLASLRKMTGNARKEDEEDDIPLSKLIPTKLRSPIESAEVGERQGAGENEGAGEREEEENESNKKTEKEKEKSVSKLDAEVTADATSNVMKLFLERHEAISGRQDEDIASTSYAFLLKVRDIEKVVIWLDNCGAQNKNWCLFTMLTHVVNSDKTETESKQLKFFDEGHTYMSADAKHKEVEKQMKSLGKVYDFDDFISCIKKAKCDPLEMGTNDGTLAFREWKSGMSQHLLRKLEKRPYLDKMVSIRFRRGSAKLEYKNDFNSYFVELDFSRATFELKEEPQKPTPRGIQSAKKQEIIDNLLPLMPCSRRAFWNNLPESKVKDLSVQYEKRASL